MMYLDNTPDLVSRQGRKHYRFSSVLNTIAHTMKTICMWQIRFTERVLHKNMYVTTNLL